jgi:hypothetical protein
MTDWLKKLTSRCKEMKGKHGLLKRIHMNDRVYHKQLPSDAWIPYAGTTDAGEMIVDDQRVEIIINDNLGDNQVILEF